MRAHFFMASAMLLISDMASAQGGSSRPDSDITQIKEPTVNVVTDPNYGKILTDSKGKTLYMFTFDRENESTCYDACKDAWPPLLINSGQPVPHPDLTGKLGVAKRRDNTRQVTYNGMPLYYYVKDKKLGDTKGHKVDNEWFVVSPEAKLAPKK